MKLLNNDFELIKKDKFLWLNTSHQIILNFVHKNSFQFQGRESSYILSPLVVSEIKLKRSSRVEQELIDIQLLFLSIQNKSGK